jgi:PDZ domain-containing protein
VHEIGGIKQKTIGARDAGADVFLVPDANAAGRAKVRGRASHRPVSNLDEALHALATL